MGPHPDSTTPEAMGESPRAGAGRWETIRAGFRVARTAEGSDAFWRDATAGDTREDGWWNAGSGRYGGRSWIARTGESSAEPRWAWGHDASSTRCWNGATDPRCTAE